jgi:DNA polymerase-3 subunit delta'
MSFNSFLGNPKAVETVRAMLSACRVPGALLFSGPEGVGKKALAVMLAKAINCERRGPRESDFCGQCARCRKADEMLARSAEDLARRRELKDAGRRVEGLVYFDVQLIEPVTRYILMEQIRSMRAIAYSRPFELSHRVFIIDPAQAIHWQAVDLLLKVLEEPPPTSTLVLICTHPRELRATIRSRAIHVPFEPAEDSVLERIAIEEPRLSASERALRLRVAAGSISALKAFDFPTYSRQRRPWLDFLGAVAGRQSSGPSEADWGMLFEATRALTENRRELESVLRVGAVLCRDLLHAQSEDNDSHLINLDLAQQLRTWSRALGFSGLQKLAHGIERAYRLQVRNVNQQLGLETTAAEILAAGAPHRTSR